MKKGMLFIIILLAHSVYASEWKRLLTSDIFKLYSTELAKKAGVTRKVSIVGTGSLSWPDGKQAIVTHLEIKQDGEKWLYRCIEYYETNMTRTSEECYELRRHSPSR